MTRFRYLICAIALAAASFGSPQQGNQKAVQIWTGGFGPTREVRVPKPRFVWQVWADGDSKITSSFMSINGKKVNASYDAQKKELYFESDDPLPAGTYEVQAKVKVDNWANFDKKWSVTVRPVTGAGAEISADSKQAIDEFNRIRRDHGFDTCRFDPYLNMASTAHTNYLSLNKEGGHSESPSKPGFTGAEPADRVSLFGHVGSSWEVVSMGGKNPADGIRGLWDAPYHRIHMMMPGPGFVGASFKDEFFTMDGEGSTRDGVFVSPADGGRDVSPSWHNQEVPDPTRHFPEAETTLGYPVVLNVYGNEVRSLKILDSKFTTASGEDVYRYELSSENDEFLQNSVILIPRKPLGSRSTYTVSLKLQDNNGKVYSKTWQFTTK